MVAKQRRQAKVAELVTRHRVWSQQELAELLGRDGISVTQATLSRDLTELGVVKGPQGYLLPDAPLASEDPGERLARSLRTAPCQARQYRHAVQPLRSCAITISAPTLLCQDR